MPGDDQDPLLSRVSADLTGSFAEFIEEHVKPALSLAAEEGPDTLHALERAVTAMLRDFADVLDRSRRSAGQ
jgi:hypothetical protein